MKGLCLSDQQELLSALDSRDRVKQLGRIAYFARPFLEVKTVPVTTDNCTTLRQAETVNRSLTLLRVLWGSLIVRS